MITPMTPGGENQVLPKSSFNALISSHAKFKERSFDTSKNVHIQTLRSLHIVPSVMLLGDSMIERFQTTGHSPNFVPGSPDRPPQPWPSPILLSDKCLESLTRSAQVGVQRIEDVFNAGVGGDKFENILYRLHGDPSRQLPGLMEQLAENDIKLWVVHAGTNNLHPKRGLSDASISAQRILLQAVLRISKPGTKIMLTGLFYRLDIPDRLVDEANVKMESLAGLMNQNLEENSVVFVAPPTTVVKEKHLEDHVHLNTEGYHLWVQYLLPKMM
ncbi:putative SGNH hydrolase-type esterase domain-containing protein [Seiridium cardinale]|uniref:SGNH hydrolase-type esterase domain-containing protein n=1 Tax=Seiridium cardinale TaxID=138064 RepID=A0ABR2XHE2_9PEZI